MRIGTALLISLLAHAILAWLLHVPARKAVREEENAVAVRLRSARPPAAPAPAEPLPPATPPAAEKPVAKERAPAPPVAPARRDWRTEIRSAVHATENDARSPYVPPPLHAGLRPGTQEILAPELDAAFKRTRRPLKVCGTMLEFQLGVHEINMPKAYLCEDRAMEYRTAPGAGRLIGEEEAASSEIVSGAARQ